MTRVGLIGALALLTACRVGVVQGADRPDDQGLLGPAPPADFECTRGTQRHLDTDNDKHADTIVWEVDGHVVCRGEDTDRDRHVDRWQKVVAGRVVEEVEDVDRNGTLDTRRKDTDGDGSLDQVTPIGPPRS
jgi:hypothetical protein